MIDISVLVFVDMQFYIWYINGSLEENLKTCDLDSWIPALTDATPGGFHNTALRETSIVDLEIAIATDWTCDAISW